jgi:hypothetical protein
MRIILLCVGRSGSHSLFKFISEHLKDHVSLHEPFNDDPKLIEVQDLINDISSIKNEKNVVIKTLLNHYPRNSFKDWGEFEIWLFDNFDKVVLLDRLDKRKQSESSYYHIKIKDKITKDYTWHTPKTYDFTEEDEEKIEGVMSSMENDSIMLLNYKEKHGYPLFYYEDIFINKDMSKIGEIFNYLEIKDINLKIYKEWIDNPRKIVKLNGPSVKLI